MISRRRELPNPGKTIYSYAVEKLIEDQLPQRVKDAMDMCGWNAFGIYELVKEELRIEKRDAKKKAEA